MPYKEKHGLKRRAEEDRSSSHQHSNKLHVRWPTLVAVHWAIPIHIYADSVHIQKTNTKSDTFQPFKSDEASGFPESQCADSREKLHTGHSATIKSLNINFLSTSQE